jgi:excisionase family DNA binding protein
MKENVKVPVRDKHGTLLGYDVIDRKTGKVVGWIVADISESLPAIAEMIMQVPGIGDEIDKLIDESSETKTAERLSKIERRLQEVPVSDRMNIDEAAQYLKLSVSSIRRKIREGSIITIKIGKAYQFKKSDLDIFLNAGRRVPHHIQSKESGPDKRGVVNHDKIARNLGLGGRRKK